MGTPLDSLDAFRSFVAGHPLAVVATVGPRSEPQAALVGIAVAPDGTLLVNSPAGARKVANVTATGRAALVIGCEGAETLQVEGEAVVLDGPDRARAVETYLYARPDSRTDPEIAFVRIRPRWLRHYVVHPDGPRVAEGRPRWVTSAD